MKEVIITSSVLILCIILIRKIFRGKISGRLQYALWLLAAIRLVLPVPAVPVAIGSLESFRAVDLAQELEKQTGDIETLLDHPVQFAMSLSVGKGLFAMPISDGPTAVFLAGKTGLTWLDILRGFWQGGMIVMALWIVGVNILFARRLHRDRREYIWDTADDGEKRVVGRTKLYTVCGLKSPCLYGLPFREAVYFPPDIAADETRLRHVLIHEMCHKRHGDGFWSLLRSLLLIVYWFDPFVWAAAFMSKRDCELACDESAIRALGEEERISYGETLLSIITRRGSVSDVVCMATTMTGNGRNMKERLRFITEKPRILGAAVALTVAIAAAAVVLVFTKDPSFHGATWEGEAFVRMPVTAGSIQIALPESIEGISGYATDKGSDLVLYQVSSGEEVGRFCELSYGEAVVLREQGKEIVPVSDYGQNPYLREYIDRQDGGGVKVTRYSYGDTADPSGGTMALVEDGAAGTDSNSDTTYIIVEDGSDETGYIRYYAGKDFYIIAEDGSDETGKAAEEITAQDYQPEEAVADSADTVYLPDEKITTTYTPTAAGNCYIYVKGDYAGVEEQYLDEMEFINDELTAAVGRAVLSD